MKQTARINIIMVVITLVFIMAFSITGKASGSGSFKSQGRIVFNNKTVSTRDDVIFDSDDFDKLAQVCR